MATAAPDPAEVRRRGRQRLIGAIAIVLLAVVFVPMVLDPEPRQERKEPTLAIPPKEGAPALPAPVPAAAPAPAKTELPAPAVSETPAPAMAEAPPAAAPSRAARSEPLMPKVATPPPPKPPDPKVVAATEAKAAAPVPAPAPAKAIGPKLEGFAVQIGAFKDEEKLKQAREKLASAKIAHFIERLPSGDLTRLRAGPYPTREAAEKGRTAVAAAGLPGQVVPLP